MPDVKTIINALPDRLRADYTKNAENFGGTTAQMDNAGDNMIANLKRMWTDLATAGFPANAFGMPPVQWIDGYVKQLGQFYGVLNEPDGPGTGGTIVGQLVAGDLMGNLENLIARTVQALVSEPGDTAGYDQWAARWKAAQS